MKTNQMLTRCPVCRSRMTVSELKCEDCGVAVRGRFEVPALCQLPRELYDFLYVFVRNRGVIREVERELGLSYPTVRARLDAVLAALGEAGPAAAPEVDREAVIARLEQGEISAEEAERLLRGEAEPETEE